MKQRILIVDDSELNRDFLSEMLNDKYKIVEAVNGRQAIAILEDESVPVDLILLDITMPEMDGFDVLQVMNERHWIDDIPVIMISVESGFSSIARAYDMGVTDYISRPFDMRVVRRRVINTLLLYAKQKRLAQMVETQIYEREKRSRLMVTILSQIVEFRNGESGLHVLNINVLTKLLLETLLEKTDKYDLDEEEISIISMASALHDIGKISIPDEILNKPGKLTKEEYEIMKTHSMEGTKILERMNGYRQEPLVQYALQICRWHHERYDGKGYPDGLKGEEIPIAAQIVSLADVYDALTSERVYKPAYTHEQAIQMIQNGECGTFSPLLLECLGEAAEKIPGRLWEASQQDQTL